MMQHDATDALAGGARSLWVANHRVCRTTTARDQAPLALNQHRLHLRSITEDVHLDVVCYPRSPR
jgi:hypothetical protein